MVCHELKGGIGSSSRLVGSWVVGVLVLANFGRLARRAGLGLARTGSFAGHYSGEIFLAFSTGTRLSRKAKGTVIETTRVAEELLDGLFDAAVDATEESVLNSLCAANSVTGSGGVTVPGLPLELVVEILQAHGRSASLSRVGEDDRDRRNAPRMRAGRIGIGAPGESPGVLTRFLRHPFPSGASLLIPA